MAQRLTLYEDNFSLTTSWDAGGKPQAVTITKDFLYDIPSGSKITSAVIRFTAGIPKYDRTFTVNGQEAAVGAVNELDVTSSAELDRCSVVFYF